MASTSTTSSLSTSFGKQIAEWTIDQTVGWLLDLSDRLHQRESLLVHLVQNGYEGTKLVQLFRAWQWEWERSGGKLSLKGRPRDITFDEDDSKMLYDETIRLCGCVAAGFPSLVYLGTIC